MSKKKTSRASADRSAGASRQRATASEVIASRGTVGRFRGRLLIVVPLAEGRAGITITSDANRSIQPAEIVTELRRFADWIAEYFMDGQP